MMKIFTKLLHKASISNRNRKISEICNRHGIKNYDISEDGCVNVNGDVWLFLRNISTIPLKFGYVSGNFNCFTNNLDNLEGSPIKVDGNFYCNNNNLKDLKGSPEWVGGNFNCQNNNLTNLKGSCWIYVV